jgi:hypothetical protein
LIFTATTPATAGKLRRDEFNSNLCIFELRALGVFAVNNTFGSSNNPFPCRDHPHTGKSRVL